MSKVSSTVLVVSKNKAKNKKIVNNYQILKKLGEGAFAKVRLVKDKKTGELFAMKHMNKQLL